MPVWRRKRWEGDQRLLRPDRKVLVVRFAVRLPKWLPDWNYWALIPAAILVAIAIAGSWPATRTASQYGGAQASAQAANGSNKVVRPETPDERLADYTGALAIFTAALVALAVLEVFFLAKTDAIAKRHADNAEKQMLLAGKQADIQEKQKEISRLQFLTTHRPKIKIRQLNKGVASVTDGLAFTYMAVNFGEANASLVEHNRTIIFSTAARGTLVNESKTKESLHGVLAPGEFVVVKFREPEITNPAFAAQINSGEIPICIFGYFAYADDLGKVRRTGFYRQYQGGVRRFVAIDDPEFEYAD